MHPGLNCDVIGDFRILNHRIRSDAALASNFAFTENLHVGFNGCVGAYFDFVIDHTSFRVQNGDPIEHQLAALSRAHLLVDLGHIHASVAAQDLICVVGFNRDNTLLGFTQQGSHVGEIKLAVSVVGTQLVDELRKAT